MRYLKLKFINILIQINKGHKRSVQAKKNILASFLIKGLNIAIGFVLVPLTINYVNQTRYGIWLTLSSIITWFSFLDIGFGNGMRNKLAEARANENYELARTYVSTTYAILFIIVVITIILFLFVNPFLNWTKILNTNYEMASELSKLAIIVFVFFCLRLVFQLINIVLIGNQEPSKADFINFSGSLLSLILIFILTKITTGNLLFLGATLSLTPVLVFIAASLLLYKNNFNKFAPSFKYVEFKYAKSLLSLGGVFFFIQIGALILFQTSNVIITQLFGPEEVTTFNVAFKLFYILSMVFTIIMTPFWSAFTDAYAKNDMHWIKSTFINIQKYWLFVSLFGIILLFVSPFIYKLWLHDIVKVPFALSCIVFMNVVAICWLMINCYLLNGIGKLRIQLYLYIISSIINIPLAIVLGKILGINGIPLANLFFLVLMGIILHIQCRKIINSSAIGIWNK